MIVGTAKDGRHLSYTGAMKKIAIVSVALLLVLGAFGASALTSAYVDRTASIDVVSDDTGLVGLSDGNSGSLVQVSGDQLQIDFSSSGANGVNTDGQFELGDPANGNQTYAFNITNNDDVAHTLSLNYTLDTAESESGANVTYEVYDSNNTQLLAATDENGEQSSSTDALSSGETVHVVVIVDTTDKTSSDDLSGTLRVKLN